MTEIHLKGRLICRDEREATLVATHLPRHVELTRAEQGCRSFSVTPTEDSLVWRVEEVFDDAASFRSHQDRVQGNQWGAVTASIERDYSITGL
ncbi:putative quinol monooxygenase [Dietzia kunjamensis]|uniref:putative quinol monooxygenase n=1 Tax=Dietzia kunjamensis TaxID=322509 RepID=UPI0039BCBBB1